MAKKDTSKHINMGHVFLGFARLSLGWVFFWAFLDKTFGLGFATTAEKAWTAGGSPTMGFLKFGTKGPFAEAFQAMAGSALVDWLFMLGLLCIGLALLLGMGLRIAGVTGALLMVLMWLAALWPENNPFMDDHIVYALVLLAFPALNAGDHLGLGTQWKKTEIVKKHSWLA